MFTPSRGKVLIRPEKAEKVTESGFILTSEEKDKPLVGFIEELGEESAYIGSKGLKVAFSRYGSDEIRVDNGETMFVVSDEGILGVYD